MNEILWLVLLVANFVAILISYRVWGKIGLFLWIPISVIIANIQVTKTISIFGIEATLGNIVYATGFLATDILSEIYGPDDSKKAVWMGFFSLICMTLFMQLAVLFVPAPSDFVNESLINIFSLMPRIATGSLIAYLCSNFHDVWAFEFWKKRNNKLWVRNNLSTMVSQLIDSVLFTFIAFYGVFSFSVLLQILLTTYLLKWVVAFCDTPLIYLARKWHREGKIKEI